MPNAQATRLTGGAHPTKFPAVKKDFRIREITPPFIPDSRQAWVRLGLAVVIGSLGSVGMWSVVVALPAVQAEFGSGRGAASLAFTLAMLGFGLGGIVAGKLADRFGIVAIIATAISAIAGMVVVFWGSSEAATYTWFIGAGCAFALYMIGSRMFGQKANYPTLDDSMVATG